MKTELIKFLHFLFCLTFLVWLVLSAAELLMPGFAIYYISLNCLFAAVCGLALADVFLSTD